MPDETAAKFSKKTKTICVVTVLVVVIALTIAGVVWYLTVQVPHYEAVEAFEVAAEGLDERNAELDQAISDLQVLMESDDEPLDSSTLDNASAAIGTAQESRDDVPDLPDSTEEIESVAGEIEAMGDYATQLKALAKAQKQLQKSIDKLKQVTVPTEQFVIKRLKKIGNITGVEAATEDNDPNGNLHKDGGYTSAVFFSSDLVDQDEVYLDEDYTGILAAATDGGGCVEVYATVEDAEERNDYLANYDGTIISSGSHTVLGTCVIRTSDLLKASEQDLLEGRIIASLTRLK